MGSRLVAALCALSLAGCSTIAPYEAVGKLDKTGQRYDTLECRQARLLALNYDDNVGGRVGVGVTAGLFLGPFGLPLAAAVDAEQAKKRDAVLDELRRSCEGPHADVLPRQRVDRLLSMLAELQSHNVLTPSEFELKRNLVLNGPSAMDPTRRAIDELSLRDGDRVVVQDFDPISNVATPELVMSIPAMSAASDPAPGFPLTIDLSAGAGSQANTAQVLGTQLLLSGSNLRQSKALFIPQAGRTLQVPVDVTVKGPETMTTSSGTIQVVRLTISGAASQQYVPGLSLSSPGSPFEGRLTIEATTGLVIEAKLMSAHPTYCFGRRFVRLDRRS